MFITTITPSTNLYTHSLPDALPISGGQICLNRNVLALLCLPEPAGDSLLKSCHVRRWNWLGASDGLQLTRHRFPRSEEHTSELQSRENIVCRLLLEKKKKNNILCVE